MINSDLIKKPFIIECLDLPQNIVVHTVYYNNDSLISVLLQIPGVDVKYRNNYMFGVNIAECFVMEKVIVEISKTITDFMEKNNEATKS